MLSEYQTSNSTFEELAAKFRESPVLSDSEEKKDAGKKKESKKAVKKPVESESDSDDSDASDNSDSEDSSSQDEDDGASSEEEDENLQKILRQDPSTLTLAQRRLRWVKKELLPWNIKKTQGDAGANKEKEDEKKKEELRKKAEEAENREF